MDILQDLQENLCVDISRIYASGKSNGGGFTNLLACNSTSAAVFAAFAPVSAALYSETTPLAGCKPGRIIPIINFHGLSDDIIPFDGRSADVWTGDKRYALPNITEYREAWARRNACNSSETGGDVVTIFSTITHPHKDTNLRVADCSPADIHSVMQGFTIVGLGHSWPTTTGVDGGTTSFNATSAEIVPFFDQHWLEHV
ncbi:hypothetical protein HWV62_30155 [Athelia sp. TMB]|nr:hypothetical protein HWV62_30155 [Athelia sp. TMB]